MKEEYLQICHTAAEPMTFGEAVEKGIVPKHEMEETHQSDDDGYCVTYTKNIVSNRYGYKTTEPKFVEIWVDKKSFEENNFKIKNAILANTCKRMVSDDYKERFSAEHTQLLNRYKGLLNMIHAWDNGTLKFTPTCPRELYDKQISAMKDYLDVLNERSIIEHNLNTTNRLILDKDEK